MPRPLLILLLSCFAGIALHAQQPPPPPPDQPGGGGFRGGRRGPPGGDRAEGKWWFNPPMVQRLGLTKDQQRKIEDIFQQNRLKLIDLTASLDREQAILDPLLAADHPQESRVLAQFDRVAEARVELEKANARMLWGFRTVLSSDQWKELQSQDGGPPGPPPGRPPLR